MFELVDGAWQNHEGGNDGPGINWTGGDIGVLRFSGEAPDAVETVIDLSAGRTDRLGG